MGRRSIGMLVLALVALAVVFLPVSGGRRVTGTAAHADVPIVGDCLVGLQYSLNEGSADDQPQYVLPSSAPGPCTAAGAGRVFAVDFKYGTPKFSSGTAGLDQVLAICRPAADAYEQRHRIAGHRWTDGRRQIGYLPSWKFSSQAVTPTPAAIAAGQRWVACITTDSLSVPVGFELSDSRLLAAFGICMPALRAEQQWISCLQPHTVEVLGSTYLDGGPTEPLDYQRACLDFARKVTGMADPNAGGKLKVQAGNTVAGTAAADCQISVVDPSGALSGSLIGIASAPLPWTS